MSLTLSLEAWLTRKTTRFALILPDITNPFFPLLSKAVENVARMHGYSVILCNADGHLGEQKRIAHIYGPQDIFTASERKQGYVDSVQAYDWYHPDLMAPGYFELEGGMDAVKHLMERHSDIDGIHLTEVIEPEITTIAQPIYDMGALAVEILVGKIAGSYEADQVYELEVNLIIRQSTIRRKFQ